MTLIWRVLGTGAMLVVMLGLGAYSADAASTASVTLRAPTAGAARPLGIPRVFQINPARINPQLQPNIMLLGQNLTPATVVLVGGRPATTVEATGYTLLARLPDGLPSGSYPLQVVGNGASSTAVDPVVVDDTPTGPSQMTMLAGGGLLALLMLVMRMARIRTYSWSR